jgi:outer membrane immunogenic protein
MKKILLSSVALLSLSAGAFAADLPSRRMAPAPYVAAVPVFTWTGFYVGGNAGYAWRDTNRDDSVFVPGGAITTLGGTPLATTGTLNFTNDSDSNRSGFAGGGQVGYNWQFGSIVLGVEADIQGVDMNGDRRGSGTYVFTGTADGVPGLNNGSTTIFRPSDRGLDYFGTVRGRLGYAFDRFMIYGTGGFAYGGGGNDDCGGFVATGFVCDGGKDTRTGYAVGGGVEWALPMMSGLFGSSAVTFGVEGLYVNLDSDNNNRQNVFVGTVGTTAAPNQLFLGNVRGQDDEFGVVRAKINFKF